MVVVWILVYVFSFVVTLLIGYRAGHSEVERLERVNQKLREQFDTVEKNYGKSLRFIHRLITKSGRPTKRDCHQFLSAHKEDCFNVGGFEYEQ